MAEDILPIMPNVDAEKFASLAGEITAAINDVETSNRRLATARSTYEMARQELEGANEQVAKSRDRFVAGRNAMTDYLAKGDALPIASADTIAEPREAKPFVGDDAARLAAQHRTIDLMERNSADEQSSRVVDMGGDDVETPSPVKNDPV